MLTGEDAEVLRGAIACPITQPAGGVAGIGAQSFKPYPSLAHVSRAKGC